MSPQRGSRRRLRRHGLARVIALGLLPLSLLGCSQPHQAAGPLVDPPTISLATSFESAGASWAIIPMGDLGSDTNTFWQLVERRSSSTRWKVATPPGVGDNGGLVVLGDGAGVSKASPAGGPLVIGFLTSNLLGFSPLARTSETAKTWTAGVLPSALTPLPDSLAGSSTGPAIALLGRHGSTVVSSSNGLNGWQTLVTRRELAKTHAASSCGVEALSAVTLQPTGQKGAPLIGAACAHEGAVGLFARDGSSWREVGPHLSGSLSTSTTEVAALVPGTSELEALVAARRKSGWSLVVLRRQTDSGAFTQSSGVPVASGGRVQSIGQGPGGGLFVVVSRGPLSSPSGERLYVLGAKSRSWLTAGELPPGTETIAYATGPSGSTTLQALVVEHSVIRFLELSSKGAWFTSQQLHVAVPYGSAS